jgi:hypothetical protein
LVEVIEPTLGSALHDLATAHPATLRRQAERVLALGVLDEQAHEVAITALVNAGEHVLADQAKRRLAALRSPEVVVRPDEPRVIFVADGELMSPMAKLTDGKLEEYPRLSDADESRMEQAMQNFADRYFVPVRAYYHYGRGGGRGIALVRRKEEPSCSSLTASFKLVSAQASPAGIVTNFPLADGERVPERAPTPAEMRTALELVRSVLVQAHVPAADRTRLLRDARKPGGALTLAAVPLRDSAFPLLVVTSNLEIPPESDRLSAPPYRAYALVLIAQADEHGRYRIDHHELARPGSEQEFNPRRFVTYMDLDQDGSDELVFAGTGYEWWWYEALGRKQGRWSQLVRGGGGGC